MGWKPSNDPKADKLINSNISQAKATLPEASKPTEESQKEGESQNG